MPRQPTLTLEEHSLRMPLTVSPGGSVSFAEKPPLTGHIDLSPILAEERKTASPPPGGGSTAVQVMMFYGRFYVVADGFHSIWELTPIPGTSSASYRSIPLTSDSEPKLLRGVRLSRYGSSESSCLRIDRKDAAPVFITAKGTTSDVCP